MTHLINNQWLMGHGPSFDSVNPANNDILWQGQGADAKQVDDAIKSARAAFIPWSLTDYQDRLAMVKRFQIQLQAQAEPMALAIAQETGKPLWETRTEAAAMAGKIVLSAKAYEERTGVVSKPAPAGTQAWLRHRPHGVVAVFGPYNFPGHLPNGHIVPALLAGNTVVFKPSEQTPLVAQLTLQCWLDAGLPQGVINLVQGAKETGVALANHHGIDGLFFTGSSSTGMLLHQQYGGRPDKILALEMGGNNPLIVSQVDNQRAAVHEIIQSAYISAGQRCTCARRLYIPTGSKGDALVDKLVSAVRKIRVGLYDAEPAPFMGSVISYGAAQQLLAAQQFMIDQGATALVKMESLAPGTGLLSPALIEVTNAKNLPDQEYFGPLLTLVRYQNLDQAIAMANDTSFGLSAGLLSDSREDYDYFLPRIRAGIVNWNKQITGASGASPFGGVGASGNHRASAFYAADYCAYPVASIEAEALVIPTQLSPGLDL